MDIFLAILTLPRKNTYEKPSHPKNIDPRLNSNPCTHPLGIDYEDVSKTLSAYYPPV